MLAFFGGRGKTQTKRHRKGEEESPLSPVQKAEGDFVHILDPLGILLMEELRSLDKRQHLTHSRAHRDQIPHPLNEDKKRHTSHTNVNAM